MNTKLDELLEAVKDFVADEYGDFFEDNLEAIKEKYLAYVGKSEEEVIEEGYSFEEDETGEENENTK